MSRQSSIKLGLLLRRWGQVYIVRERSPDRVYYAQSITDRKRG